MNSMMPPSRPGSSLGGLGVRTDNSGSSKGPSKFSPNSSTSWIAGSTAGRPPVLLMIFLIINLLVPLAVLGLTGFVGDVAQHGVGVVFGMFLSVILLGLFRQSLNKRRGDGRFSDWRVSSTSFSSVVSATAWLLGIVNLFVVCLEISRRFT